MPENEPEGGDWRSICKTWFSDREIPGRKIPKETDPISECLSYEHAYNGLTLNQVASVNNALFSKEEVLYRPGKRVPPKKDGIKADPSEGTEAFEQIPILNKGGIRCAAYVPKHSSDEFVEIQLNFIGTIDSKSLAVDLEPDGPGSKSFKRNEKEILEKINAIVHQVKVRDPGKEIRLRISGHSLGGTLAKFCTHALQRAITAQDASDCNAIANTIKHNAEQTEMSDNKKYQMPDNVFEALTKTLRVDKKTFANLGHLKTISKITLYTKGAPGVSKKTAVQAALLSHAPCFRENFLTVRQQIHAADKIFKYGTAEIFSDKTVVPNITDNKLIVFDTAITKSDKDSFRWPRGTGWLQSIAVGLGFWLADPKIWAAHNVNVSSNLDSINDVKVYRMHGDKLLTKKITKKSRLEKIPLLKGVSHAIVKSVAKQQNKSKRKEDQFYLDKENKMPEMMHMGDARKKAARKIQAAWRKQPEEQERNEPVRVDGDVHVPTGTYVANPDEISIDIVTNKQSEQPEEQGRNEPVRAVDGDNSVAAKP